MYWPPTHTLTDRFTSIIGGLCGVVAQQALRTAIAGPLTAVLWNKLQRFRRRIAEIAEQVRNGTLPAIPPPRPRSASSQPAAPRPAAATPPKPGLPREFGWLVRIMPEPYHVNHWRNLLEAQLDDPEVKALAAAAPQQLGHELRPLCHMLAIKPPPHLRLPRRPRSPRPPRVKPAPKPKTPEQAAARINSMSRMAYADMVHPEPEPIGLRPPNRIGDAAPGPWINWNSQRS